MAQRPDPRPPGSKKADVVAGAGGGGLLVYCAQHFISDPALSQIALYACPGLSVVFAGLYQKLNEVLSSGWEYLLNEIVRKRTLRQSEENVADIRRQLAIIEADPNATAAHKAEMREHLQMAEKVHMRLRLKGSVTTG